MTLITNPIDPVIIATSEGPGYAVRRLFCVGRNYAAHAREMGRDPDRDPPFFFTKWAETVVPSGATVPYPQSTANFHHEAELVVAIGAPGRDIAAADAHKHIYGYAAGLDMTRRDLQLAARENGLPWDVSKNVERSAPIGLLHSAAEVGHLDRGRIWLTVNGEVRQDADLTELIWPVDAIVSYVSAFYRLEPGDLIYTGTPAGVNSVEPGDEVAVNIEGLSECRVLIGAHASE